jgi:hypothetical protein
VSEGEPSRAPAISGRLVRSAVRYLRERLGAAQFDSLAQRFVERGIGGDWIALDDWLAVLRSCEARHGDPGTLRLLRELTRATMAAAISTVWGTFLADATPETLLDRVGFFWSVSFDTGRLMVAERGPGRARLSVEGWRAPPPEVAAMVSEACAVFLARLGAMPRVVERRVNGRLEIDGAW